MNIGESLIYIWIGRDVEEDRPRNRRGGRWRVKEIRVHVGCVLWKFEEKDKDLGAVSIWSEILRGLGAENF